MRGGKEGEGARFFNGRDEGSGHGETLQKDHQIQGVRSIETTQRWDEYSLGPTGAANQVRDGSRLVQIEEPLCALEFKLLPQLQLTKIRYRGERHLEAIERSRHRFDTWQLLGMMPPVFLDGDGLGSGKVQGGLPPVTPATILGHAAKAKIRHAKRRMGRDVTKDDSRPRREALVEVH